MPPSSDWVLSSSNKTIKTGLVELIKFRPILYALVKRELKSRYRGSALGFAWALGKPLSMLLVFSLVIGEILGASRSIEYFALYLFIGLMFWGFFSEAINVGTNSIVNSSGLVQKVAFPREILPLTAVVVAFVNLLIQVPVLLLGYLIFAKWPQLLPILNLVPLLIIWGCLVTAFALLLSSVNVYIRDVQPLTELLIMLLMYATPVIYSWTFVKEKVNSNLFDLYIHNPITLVLVGIQDTLWPGVRRYSDGEIAKTMFTYSSPSVWLTLIFSIFLLILSYRIFLKLEPNFAREL